MRRDFHPLLLHEMRQNPRIHLISIDLGYKMWNSIIDEFPDRYHQFSATEQAAMAAAVGMTHDGLTPIVYSICPFLLFRPAEIIRLYLAHENAPVKLLAAGRYHEDGTEDYAHDGFSHASQGDREFLALYPNVQCFWPETKEDLKRDVRKWLDCPAPAYLNLKR